MKNVETSAYSNNLLHFLTFLEDRPDHMLKQYLCRSREITVFVRKRHSLASKVSLHETFGSKKAFLGTQAACERHGNCSIFKHSAAFFHNFGRPARSYVEAIIVPIL